MIEDRRRPLTPLEKIAEAVFKADTREDRLDLLRQEAKRLAATQPWLTEEFVYTLLLQNILMFCLSAEHRRRKGDKQ